MKEPTLQDWKNAYARFIRYRMNAMDLSVEQLARKASLPVGYIRRCVAADVCPAHIARKAMARPLGASLEFISPKQGS